MAADQGSTSHDVARLLTLMAVVVAGVAVALASSNHLAESLTSRSAVASTAEEPEPTAADASPAEREDDLRARLADLESTLKQLERRIARESDRERQLTDRIAELEQRLVYSTEIVTGSVPSRRPAAPAPAADIGVPATPQTATGDAGGSANLVDSDPQPPAAASAEGADPATGNPLPPPPGTVGGLPPPPLATVAGLSPPAPPHVAAAVAAAPIAATRSAFAIDLGPLAAADAAAVWQRLQETHGDLLGNLTPRLATRTGADGTALTHLVAGPIANLAEVFLLCGRLAHHDVSCVQARFEGSEPEARAADSRPVATPPTTAARNMPGAVPVPRPKPGPDAEGLEGQLPAAGVLSSNL